MSRFEFVFCYDSELDIVFPVTLKDGIDYVTLATVFPEINYFYADIAPIVDRGEHLRQRAEDQQLPTPNDNPSIHGLVIEDIRERLELGINRYGTPLQAHNGRNALRDAYEEVLDLAVYVKQVLEEQKNG